MARSPTAARTRDRYADVGRATRAAFEQARNADLTRNELLTLLAVLDATVTWSRLDERLTIRQVASRRYGVEEQEATRTHTNKTTAALRGLAAKGVIVYETRPGGKHRIGLPPAPAAPTGGTRPRSDPGRDPRPDPGRDPASCTLYARDEEVPRTISEPTPHRPAGEVSEPGLVSGRGGDGPEDPLVGRLVALCGPAHRRSATAVVAKLCRDFDRRVIEEMVTWVEQAEQPTRSPRRLLAMAETWGPQRGVFPTSGTAAVGTGPPPELVDDLSGGSASGDRWPPVALSGTHVAGFDVDAGDELAVPAELPAGFFDELRERLRGGRAAAGGQL
jgi:hypothetical protein